MDLDRVGNVPNMVPDGSSLTYSIGGASIEIEILDVTGVSQDGNTIAGQFTLSFAGQTTQDLGCAQEWIDSSCDSLLSASTMETRINNDIFGGDFDGRSYR